MPAKSNASQNTGSVFIKDRSYTRHSKHWYEDGNFGFLVEEIAFLVHRSVLSRRSSFMADLFSLPQRAPSEPDGNLNTVDSSLVIDGAPYVILRDKAEDLQTSSTSFIQNQCPLKQTMVLVSSVSWEWYHSPGSTYSTTSRHGESQD
ncbi:hypothetical protein FS837_005156 [Tulasnella sp. UAMH 9824]|nr:hypothetical protein FS837_005156 [Tulasnella sp. UAMH 9824]